MLNGTKPFPKPVPLSVRLNEDPSLFASMLIYLTIFFAPRDKTLNIQTLPQELVDFLQDQWEDEDLFS